MVISVSTATDSVRYKDVDGIHRGDQEEDTYKCKITQRTTHRMRRGVGDPEL